MNDEDFARSVLTHALPTLPGEPGLSLDVEQLVHDGRRSTRVRRLGLATGGAALASLLAVAAWGVLSLGGGAAPTTSVGPAAATGSQDANEVAKASASAPAEVVSKGVACTSSKDLVAIAKAALPVDIVVASSSSGCTDVGGTRVISARLDLIGGVGTVMVEVDTSAGAAGQASSVEKDRAKAATTGGGWVDNAPDVTCTPAQPSGTVCLSTAMKADTKSTLLSLKIPGNPDLAVQITDIGSAGGPVPLTDVEVTSLATAVAQAF